ncbi:tyrosine-type recombinase/integrase (plasmid) [Borrelia hermsii]|nr:site-specific integrase [Borrelia hermsii]UVY98944.1 tyrosine-type recombinase/integrase [Borrelia hermsii]
MSQLKSTLKSKNKASKQSKNTPLRFYLNDKTIRLVKKYIKELIQINPISGWFVYILSITDCRGVEIQNVRLSDVSKETSSDGEVFYSLRVNVAKKRSSICIREVVISKSEFDAIMQAHQAYFASKGKDKRRTYFFQKSKHKFCDNRISITEISKQFKSLLLKARFRLHICCNIFKYHGDNSLKIKELMKYLSTTEIYNAYELFPASKVQAYKNIKNSLK